MMMEVSYKKFMTRKKIFLDMNQPKPIYLFICPCHIQTYSIDYQIIWNLINFNLIDFIELLTSHSISLEI